MSPEPPAAPETALQHRRQPCSTRALCSTGDSPAAPETALQTPSSQPAAMLHSCLQQRPWDPDPPQPQPLMVYIVGRDRSSEEEEKKTLENSSTKLKELVDNILKFKSDPEFINKEESLKNSVEKFHLEIKERKHKRFVKDCSEFKEKRAYPSLQVTTATRGDISSSDIDSSDIDSAPRGALSKQFSRPKNRGRRGGRRWQNYGSDRGYQPSTSSSSSSFLEDRGGVYVPSTKPKPYQPPLAVTQFEQDDNQVINLSSYILTMSEKQVLKKGLTFVPTMRFDPFTWIKDLNLFTRKLRWRNFFYKNDSQKCQQLGISVEDLSDLDILTELSEEGSRVAGEGPFSDLKPTSSRMPPSCDFGSIDVFQKLVTDEINSIIPSLDPTHPNLTSSERRSLNDLKNNTSLVIKPSDKGGNTVIMDYENYTKMCMSILSDVSSYEILKGNPTADYTAELSRLLTRAFESKLISKSEFSFLLPKFPMVSTFYALPKIHKGYNPLKGRPIVSGVDALSQNSSIYLDRLLRPFVTALPSYIRDTSDLLTKLEGVMVEPDTIIASIDVEALYSSIRHKDGLGAIEHYISSRGVHCGRHNTFLLELLGFVLQRNYFLFGGKYYHQLRGTAMGSPCAPTYANLLLGWWEDTLIFKDEDEIWSPRIIFWGRFIDDILVLWRGDACSFSDFVAYLNTTIEGLFFTFEIGGQSINFLDVNICRQGDGSLSTTIFRKPTATNSLLRWESHHPFPLKRAPTGLDVFGWDITV
ncbi:unnamed protein product [Ranitomeya imitator]|uniref:Reverse transcriptase domain-containing protein n=1 Tax=Ranitomeya imitator TaxID=111125 RepID=A0ABN9LD17_9NEOB|nr:unnamed protein product [Ranitomeya imitator]